MSGSASASCQNGQGRSCSRQLGISENDYRRSWYCCEGQLLLARANTCLGLSKSDSFSLASVSHIRIKQDTYLSPNPSKPRDLAIREFTSISYQPTLCYLPRHPSQLSRHQTRNVICLLLTRLILVHHSISPAAHPTNWQRNMPSGLIQLPMNGFVRQSSYSVERTTSTIIPFVGTMKILVANDTSWTPTWVEKVRQKKREGSDRGRVIQVSKPMHVDGVEWLSVKIHGQSFMLHQIRKMMCK